jgi:1-acyl-sn-glycerol-3-phosphate acyltransferase
VDLLGAPPDDVVLAPPHAVLKTSSGKIRRAATRDVYCGEGFGAGGRAPWLQVLRLGATGLWQGLRGTLRRGGGLLYGACAWSVYGLLLPPALAGILLLPDAGMRWRFARTLARVCVRLCGIRLQVTGLEHLHPQAGIFVANHASYVDSIVLAAALPMPVSFVAKQELSTHAFAGPLLRRLGVVFVERFDARQGVDDVRRLAATAGERPLFFFAEGTFTRQPGVRPFRLGAFQIAVQNRLAVTPVVWPEPANYCATNPGFHGALRCKSRFANADYAATGEGWQAALQLRDATRREILKHLRRTRPGLARAARASRPGARSAAVGLAQHRHQHRHRHRGEGDQRPFRDRQAEELPAGFGAQAGGFEHQRPLGAGPVDEMFPPGLVGGATDALGETLQPGLVGRDARRRSRPWRP